MESVSDLLGPGKSQGAPVSSLEEAWPCGVPWCGGSSSFRITFEALSVLLYPQLKYAGDAKIFLEELLLCSMNIHFPFGFVSSIGF